MVCKMKDDTADAAIDNFFGIKPKMFLYLKDDSSEYKRSKDINKNVVATIGHTKYKDVLLNKNFLSNSMNEIQINNHITGTYEFSKISFSCFDDKICIQNNGRYRLALGY